MNDTQLITALAAIKPLTKPHHSVHLLNTPLFGADKKDILSHYVRITKSFPVSVEWPKQIQIDLGAPLCKEHGASFCLHTNPWMKMEAAGKRADDWGTEFVADMTNFDKNLSTLKTNISKTNIPVSTILLDYELWTLKTDKASAMDAKASVIFSTIAKYFPAAETVIYARGGVNYDNAKGWSNNEAGFTTLNEPGDYFSPDLYFLTEVYLMEEVFRRNLKAASEKGYKKVIPWIALGGAGVRDGISIIQWTTPPHDYPFVNSYRMGFDINYSWGWQFPERFGDWSNVPCVCFWPAAFDPMCPNWGKHFLAYCQGANSVKMSIPD